MKETRTIGYIDNGVFIVLKKDEFIRSVLDLQYKDERTYIDLIAKKRYKKRSDKQNRYYWGYLIKEFQRLYFEQNKEKISTEEVHNFFKNEFNYIELINEGSGEIKRIGKSTTQNTTVEFINFCDKCARFISEWFGVEILEPNEQSSIKF